jgi:hypothetical protein
MEEHLRQLAGELERPGGRREQSLRFVQSFVRPHGLERPAAPLMVEAIEQLARVKKRRRMRPFWLRPAQWAMLAMLRGKTRRAKRAG